MENNTAYDVTNDENEAKRTGKPLIDLIYRLIQGDAKQTLTDVQLIEILQHEFEIDVINLHCLEKDVYLTVMKKFLKVWPEWTEFDTVVNNLKYKTTFEKNRVFEKKYVNLKNYLKSVLDTAMPLVKETVQSALNNGKCNNTQGEVVMEIETLRESLSNLFFRYPNLKYNNTIFNIATAEPLQTKDTANLSLQCILNWWDVKVVIFPPITDPYMYIYKRETKHEFKYMLMNKRLSMEHVTAKVLDQEIKVQMQGKRDKVKTYTYIDVMKNIGLHYSETVKDISELFDFVLKDLSLLPEFIITPATYKRFTNKYPYVRYLYEHVDKVSPNNYEMYDIQLEETIKPAYQVTLRSMQKVNELIDWSVPINPVILECCACSVIFKGTNVINDLKEHFSTSHRNEIFCRCTNCAKKFEIEALSSNWWCHEC